jgi:hypothetical protein
MDEQIDQLFPLVKHLYRVDTNEKTPITPVLNLKVTGVIVKVAIVHPPWKLGLLV